MNYYYVRWTHYDSIHFNRNNRLTIKPLSNKKAAELGSEMIAESLLTMIPITFVIIAMKKKYKEEQQLKEMDANLQKLTVQYDNLYDTVNVMQSQLMRLNDLFIVPTQGIKNMDIISEEIGKKETVKFTESAEKLENIDITNDTDTVIVSVQDLKRARKDSGQVPTTQ